MFEDLFTQRLHYFREQKGKSARDMSLSIGQNPGYIRGLEHKQFLPSMMTFFYICDYLGVSPSEFFDDKNDSPERMRKLYQDLLSMSSKQLDIIESVIRGIKK